MILVQQSGK